MARLLTPLVRILLRHGFSFGAFSDLLKQVYVTVAERDFTVAGRKQTTSRIAVLTGLNRKEVARLRRLPEDTPDAVDERYNRAARVLTGWLRDPEFQDAAGEPDVLDADARFAMLVHRYSGDMPARAILDELERVGAVARTDDGALRLVQYGYIPAGDAVQKLQILGTDTRDLIATIEHNLEHGAADPRFQRKVAYDNVPEEYIQEFRTLAARRSQELLEELDVWLAARDRDQASGVEGTGRVRLGLGIHEIEERHDAEDADSAGENKQ